MRLTLVSLACAVALCAIRPVDARAQSSLQIPLQFDFLNPGARSLALGSAFVGLADDATAAFTNPAGLTTLLAPEVSLEVRGRRTETLFVSGGRLGGTPSGRGIDTIAGPAYGESISSFTDPVFASFVYPRGSWAVALYRHDLIHIEFDLEGQGVFEQINNTGNPVFDTGRQPPIRANRQLHIVNYGTAAAMRIGNHLSIGGGLSVYDFTFDTVLRRFGTRLSAPGEPSGFNSADFSREIAHQEQTGRGQSLGGSVGVRWYGQGPVSLGAVYRIGPAFDFSIVEGRTSTGKFRVPDVLTLGAQYRPYPALTFVGDYSLVRYSKMQDDFVALQTITSGRATQFAIDNVSEVHAGAEYVFTTAPGTPAIRAGFWFDPDHTPDYTPTSANDYLDALFTAYLATGKDLWHYTFGGGISLTRRFEVNAAADFSDRTRNVSASIVARF